jgi:hypothetical protein
MEIRLISPEGLEHRHVDELDRLLAGPDLVWVDVPSWDELTVIQPPAARPPLENPEGRPVLVASTHPALACRSAQC